MKVVHTVTKQNKKPKDEEKNKFLCDFERVALFQDLQFWGNIQFNTLKKAVRYRVYAGYSHQQAVRVGQGWLLKLWLLNPEWFRWAWPLAMGVGLTGLEVSDWPKSGSLAVVISRGCPWPSHCENVTLGPLKWSSPTAALSPEFIHPSLERHLTTLSGGVAGAPTEFTHSSAVAAGRICQSIFLLFLCEGL